MHAIHLAYKIVHRPVVPGIAGHWCPLRLSEDHLNRLAECLQASETTDKAKGAASDAADKTKKTASDATEKAKSATSTQ